MYPPGVVFPAKAGQRPAKLRNQRFRRTEPAQSRTKIDLAFGEVTRCLTATRQLLRIICSGNLVKTKPGKHKKQRHEVITVRKRNIARVLTPDTRAPHAVIVADNRPVAAKTRIVAVPNSEATARSLHVPAQTGIAIGTPPKPRCRSHWALPGTYYY